MSRGVGLGPRYVWHTFTPLMDNVGLEGWGLLLPQKSVGDGKDVVDDVHFLPM